MKPLLVGVACALVLPFAVGGIVSFIDTACFPDLVYENMGYGIITALRLVPLMAQSVVTGCMVGQLLAAQGKAAGWTGLIGGGVTGFLLLLVCRGDYSDHVPGESIVPMLRLTFFEWGEYLIWAILLVLSGVALLVRGRRRQVISEPGTAGGTVWPPPPSR